MRLGECYRCGRTQMINVCTAGDAMIGEYCADCFDKVPHDPPPRNRTAKTSGRNHNGHSFDNVVRLMEDKDEP